MKKSIIIATFLTLATLLAPFSASAQHDYRGFVDAEIGAAIATDLASGNSIALGVSTTHGYQIWHWFIGAGVSFMWTPNARYISGTQNYFPDPDSYKYVLVDTYDKCKLSLPLYVILRYDFSLISKRSFYFAMKVGYDVIWNGVFASPSFGLRKSLDNGHALNFGLNINIKSGNNAGHFGDEFFFFSTPTLSVGYEF